MMLPELALSIRQPWAWAIVHAGKDVENRSWRTDQLGPVCIHAAKGCTAADRDAFAMHCAMRGLRVDPPPADGLLRGGIIGVATVVACVRSSSSPWFAGPWGFVLAEMRPVPFIPVRGALGFFRWRENATGDPGAAQERLI